MPIYVYKCAKCEHVVDELQKSSDPPPKTCEKCKAKDTMERQMGSTSFILKGGGWFKDGY